MRDVEQVFLQVPNITDLYCIHCKVNVKETLYSFIKSQFHCQILMCRLVISSLRFCIAAPPIQYQKDTFHVIVSKKFYSTGKLQLFLTNLKIEFTNPELVDPRIYEACLRYTITFKLAPFWNFIGKSFYVYGWNFMSLHSTDAVEWNILFRDYGTELEIKPFRINLFPLTLDYFGISTSIVNNFKTNDDYVIDSINWTSFQDLSVYVLPKLSEAKIVSVFTKLPKNSFFNNYNDFRRHWKNMHSYRLPKTDKGMLFYEVVFSVNPNQRFIYPELGIFSKMPVFSTCNNKNQIISKFIKDLQSRINFICDTPLKISNLFPKLDIQYSCTLTKKNHHLFPMVNNIEVQENDDLFYLSKIENNFQEHKSEEFMNFTNKYNDFNEENINSFELKLLKSIIDEDKKECISKENELDINNTDTHILFCKNNNCTQERLSFESPSIFDKYEKLLKQPTELETLDKHISSNSKIFFETFSSTTAIKNGKFDDLDKSQHIKISKNTLDFTNKKNETQKSKIDNVFTREICKSSEILNLTLELEKRKNYFHSILSQFSVKSSSSKRESYELICKESLTFST